MRGVPLEHIPALTTWYLCDLNYAQGRRYLNDEPWAKTLRLIHNEFMHQQEQEVADDDSFIDL
jgi:hypothetical protein